MPASEPWRGDLSVRAGLIAFTGRVGSAESHAHAAVQVYRCDRGEVEVTDGSGAAVVGDRLVVPTRTRHRVRSSAGTLGTTVFLDPSADWAPRLDGWERSVTAWADDERGAYVDRVLARLTEVRARPRDSFGDRIEQWVRARLPGAVTVPELASALAVSEATLRRIARTELGLGVSAYTRWVRLVLALERVAQGASITEAAHHAGFADGSHATRACREMFGLTPSDAIAHLRISTD